MGLTELTPHPGVKGAGQVARVVALLLRGRVLLRRVLQLVVVLRRRRVHLVRVLLRGGRRGDVVVLHHVRLLRVGHHVVLGGEVLAVHARGALGGHLVDGGVRLQLAARVLHGGGLLGHVGGAHRRRVGPVAPRVVHHEAGGAVLAAGGLARLGAVVAGGPDVQPVVRRETGVRHARGRLPRGRGAAIVVRDALAQAGVARGVRVDLRALVRRRRVVVRRAVAQVGDVRVGEV